MTGEEYGPLPNTRRALESFVDESIVDELLDNGSEFRESLDGAFAAKSVETSKLDKTEAETTYVRFVDLAGNPITARHVTITVDTATWEIADIIAEV